MAIKLKQSPLQKRLLVRKKKAGLSIGPPSGVSQVTGSTGALPNLKSLITEGKVIAD